MCYETVSAAECCHVQYVQYNNMYGGPDDGDLLSVETCCSIYLVLNKRCNNVIKYCR